MGLRQHKLDTGDILLYVMAFAALCAVLTFTYAHTAEAMTKWTTNPWVGYVGAIGIELGIAGLAVRRTMLKRIQQDSKLVNTTLTMLLAMSSCANFYTGFEAFTQTDFTINAVFRVDPAQLIMGVLLTALVPVVVYATGDIVGADLRRVKQTLQRLEMVAVPFDAVPTQPAHRYTCPCGWGGDKAIEKANHARYCEVVKKLKAEANA